MAEYYYETPEFDYPKELSNYNFTIHNNIHL